MAAPHELIAVGGCFAVEFGRLMLWRLTTMIGPTNNLTKKFVQFVARVTPHCHEITRLLSESMEHPLPLRTRLLIRLHFVICVWCQRYGDQLKLLRKCGSGFAETGCERGAETLPSATRERLKKALERTK
jgi:hypothetical protein